jgi:hypothetical protein
MVTSAVIVDKRQHYMALKSLGGVYSMKRS